MNIIAAIALFGAGYMYNDCAHTIKSNYRSYSSCSSHARHPESIKDYLKDVAIDKLNAIFYGNAHDRRKNQNLNFNLWQRKETIDYSTCNSKRRGLPWIAYECYEISFSTRKEAEDVIEDMIDFIKTYGNASVADFLRLSNKDSMYDDNLIDLASKYGWKEINCDLSTVYYDNTRFCYFINLPEPAYLDVKQ